MDGRTDAQTRQLSGHDRDKPRQPQGCIKLADVIVEGALCGLCTCVQASSLTKVHVT